MKLLFVSSTDVELKTYGGSQCTNRNYLSFCEILGADNIQVINLTAELNESLYSKIPKWLNYLRGYSRGLSKKIIKKVIKLSKESDYIFIDSSEYGILNYYLKKENLSNKVISFFHNIEYNIRLENLKINALSFWKFAILYYNERRAFKYADKIVVLNQRDKDELLDVYGKSGIDRIHIIPISFADIVGNQIDENIHEYTSIPPTCIFIGHYWYANVHGIKWFVDNVLDSVNIRLQIIGNGMEVLRKELTHPKIELLGFVPDLSAIIKNADYVIIPIFKGSGMKVKTCEALMYGKNIIGTKEAFEGYDIDYEKVGAICRNKEEFINSINLLTSNKREKFNKYSREFFLEKYSFQATLKDFEGLLYN